MRYEFCYDEVTVTSFISIIHFKRSMALYNNVAVEIIPQGTAFSSVIRLLWAKGRSANPIQSEMRPLYGDKYFTRPPIHVWCKKFDHGRESVVDEDEPGRRVVSTTDATITAVDSYMVKPACEVINVYINLDDALKSETLMFEVQTRLLVGLVHFSLFNSQCCPTLASCKRKLLGKILH